MINVVPVRNEMNKTFNDVLSVKLKHLFSG